MITYKEMLNGNRDIQQVRVYLDSRLVGVIRKSGDGWQYKPSTGGAGPIFPTIATVKRMLEGR